MVESANKAVLRTGFALAQCLSVPPRCGYLAVESLWVSRVTEGR